MWGCGDQRPTPGPGHGHRAAGRRIDLEGGEAAPGRLAVVARRSRRGSGDLGGKGADEERGDLGADAGRKARAAGDGQLGVGYRRAGGGLATVRIADHEIDLALEPLLAWLGVRRKLD